MSGNERWREDNWRRSRGSYEPSNASSSGASASSRGRGRGPSQGPGVSEPPAGAYGPYSPERERGGPPGLNRGGRGGGGRGGQIWRGPPPGLGGGGGGSGWRGAEDPLRSPVSPSETMPSPTAMFSPPSPSTTTHTPQVTLPRDIYAFGRPALLESRLNDDVQDALVTAFGSLSVTSGFPHRPGWGTVGEPVKYRVNHFPIQFPKTVLYDYRVRIDPKPTIARIRKRIYNLLEATPEFAHFRDHIVHDSANRMIASRRLPIPAQGTSISLRYFDEDEPGPTPRSVVYTLTITYNTQLDTHSLSRCVQRRVSINDT